MKKHHGEILNGLIKEFDLKLDYVCKRLELSRPSLNKHLKDGNFKQWQKALIIKLEKGLNATK